MNKSTLIDKIVNHCKFSEFVEYLALDRDYINDRLSKDCSYDCVDPINLSLWSELALHLFQQTNSFEFIQQSISNTLFNKCSKEQCNNVLNALNSGDFDSVKCVFVSLNGLALLLKFSLKNTFDDYKNDLIEMFQLALIEWVFNVKSIDDVPDCKLKTHFIKLLPLFSNDFITKCSPSYCGAYDKVVVALNMYTGGSKLERLNFHREILKPYLELFYNTMDFIE